MANKNINPAGNEQAGTMERAGRRIKKLRHRIISPLRSFLRDSRAVGIVLILCTIVSLVLSNLDATSQSYTAFWSTETHSFSPSVYLPHNYLLWVNDGLMVLFFFLVGMEIKRELIIGELASLRKSMLPVCAALGGMMFPALIFLLFNGNTPFHHGWGIPMATDIAFSLGVISLLGKKVPLQLKIFLTALAIIDDLGAIIVIAVFYSSGLNMIYLFIGLGVLLIPIILNLLKVQRLFFYIIPGIIIWYCILNSGIHATIAGVLLAFCIPVSRIPYLEHILSDVVNFIVMPVFAIANTAIVFPEAVGHIFTSTITFGIIAGLVIGKPLGIFIFSFISTKLKVASLPSGTTWKQILGVGAMAGIGFTMSIFIATLAYKPEDLQVISKIAILCASVIAGIFGYVYLKMQLKNKKPS